MPDPVTRLNAALEGRYTIERELGEGGMATVYLAQDIKHNRKVALRRSATASTARSSFLWMRRWLSPRRSPVRSSTLTSTG